jgi:2-polyprenyl-6-methoxyphenol hydroxylase-like FAD-dependent oxidoreductase
MTVDREEVPVVVVGAGPAGLTAAITLARSGIETLLLERRPQPSSAPRATAISTSTMEVMRTWGLERWVREGEFDAELQPWLCTTLASARSGRALDAGFPTREQSALISPTAPASVPQSHLEPVLEGHLRSLSPARVERGAEVTEVTSGPEGVTLTIRDRAAGRERVVRSRYLIAADGIRSTVRNALGIPVSGRDDLAERLVVLFRAPLWQLLGKRRFVIYLITGGPRPSFFVPAGLPDRWVFGAEWDPTRDRLEDLTPSDVTRLLRLGVGDPSLEPKIEHLDTVTYGVHLAERFRDGRVFLAGDAAHRVTPRGGTGMNTAIRDGYDLGWKLAWVLRGWATERLFDTYEAERRPVAEHNMARSADPNGSERSVADELRADLGGRIAHLWLPGESGRVSTLDLLGDGLTLITGPAAGAWEAAAGSIRVRGPLTIRSLDPLTARALGITGRGALLVRPDGHPAALWSGDEDEARALRAAMRSVTLAGPPLLEERFAEQGALLASLPDRDDVEEREGHPHKNARRRLEKGPWMQF